ncbi:MAG: hypothetical protein QOH19_2294 [Actinomycetota bacterium]|jgi:hypothetical protein|nr:hypothetical protein [Actinomycetota bacterium]
MVALKTGSISNFTRAQSASPTHGPWLLKAGAGPRDQFQKRLKIFGTLKAIFNKETSGNADVDLHGETVLTDEDTHFIRPKAHKATAPWAPSDYRSFDAGQP